MRRLIFQMMVTLDGFTAGPGGELDWGVFDEDFDDDELQDYLIDLLRSVDAFVFGRVAYELLSEYWPTADMGASTDRERELARLMNAKLKIVFSRAQPELRWDPATLLSGDIADEVSRLKEQPGKDLVLFAGATIASVFMNLDLVDEYRIMVNPVVLGDGQPLFAGVRNRRELVLTDTRTFPSGVVMLRYQPDRAQAELGDRPV